ncbi:conserved hypothetical protein [Frankia sp. Hr75.2]|nr:conserved hypothetical protein [Frankia sp. Hr75.2]
MVRDIAMLTRGSYLDALRASLVDQGWVTVSADSLAAGMARLVHDWPVGAVAERRLDTGGAWQIVDPKMPAVGAEWTTITGAKVMLDPKTKGLHKPCAAMKLLPALPELKPVGKPVEYVHMSEMVFIGESVEVFDDPDGPKDADYRDMRVWKGTGASCSWTAHSCRPCETRIPYLICDVPTNMIGEPAG